MFNLPSEITNNILSYLDYKDLAKARLVNKDWLLFAEDSLLRKGKGKVMFMLCKKYISIFQSNYQEGRINEELKERIEGAASKMILDLFKKIESFYLLENIRCVEVHQTEEEQLKNASYLEDVNTIEANQTFKKRLKNAFPAIMTSLREIKELLRLIIEANNVLSAENRIQPLHANDKEYVQTEAPKMIIALFAKVNSYYLENDQQEEISFENAIPKINAFLLRAAYILALIFEVNRALSDEQKIRPVLENFFLEIEDYETNYDFMDMITVKAPIFDNWIIKNGIFNADAFTQEASWKEVIFMNVEFGKNSLYDLKNLSQCSIATGLRLLDVEGNNITSHLNSFNKSQHEEEANIEPPSKKPRFS